VNTKTKTMKKILFIAVIILGLSSCATEYTPIENVTMDVMEYKFTEDTTSFDSYVKIVNDTYYFYTMDEKELYAKVPVKSLTEGASVLSAMLGLLIGLFIGWVISIILD